MSIKLFSLLHRPLLTRNIAVLALQCFLLVMACRYTANTYAHAYVDFAIDDVWLDKKCYLHVAIRNTGGDLPDHFYFSRKPAVLKITKGQQEEASASFTKLDKKKFLSSDKDLLVIKSKTVFANNIKPVNVSINYGPEFGDFNQRNDSLTRAMDCKVGDGQIAGEAIEYTAPDVAINHVSIDEEHCTLKLELFNKTGIALDQGAWSKDNGVAIIIKNADTGARQDPISLITMDPNQKFTRSTHALSWQSDFEISDMPHASVAVWYVTGDSDFTNNEQTIDVPDSCAKKINK